MTSTAHPAKAFLEKLKTKRGSILSLIRDEQKLAKPDAAFINEKKKEVMVLTLEIGKAAIELQLVDATEEHRKELLHQLKEVEKELQQSSNDNALVDLDGKE
ncbi:hypothetical protein F5Y19DRAFT_481159 [Xylariaceae sp. FL1651]|nr:hypothetical protein F5Y19DRAFT_481159 [Xylariaceae sp. FL1651]